MNRSLYILCIVAGIGVFIYLYIFNFDNMSETELVNNVLYWYVPIIFGLFGLFALRLKRSIGEETSAIKYMFSGKHQSITVWSIILLVATGIVGVILFFIPLSLIKPNTKSYDVYVAAAGTLIWLAALWFFFVALWPSL